MARSKRLAFSGQHLAIERIDRNLRDVDASVNAYFMVGDGGSTVRFLGYTSAEMQAEKTALLEEFRRSASMDLFGAIEAAFRIDFLQRCYRREKDTVSTAFRRLYGDRDGRVSLDDILSAWRQNSTVSPDLVAALKDAFKYRHWLAHGRYWVPRFPKLDYDEIYTRAETALEVFPFKGT